MNMAIDETLFRSAVDGLTPPTVRLYAWSRPTLSIGFRQNLSATCDLEACRSLGIDTVRRMSGGRAVLHHQELTYCVAAGAEGPFRGLSVREVYGWVSCVLHRGLERKGIPVDPPSPLHKRSIAPPLSPPSEDALPCFAVPTGHELTSGGRKLVGGAQKWSRRGFVQHGSILLDIDTTLWSQVIGVEAATAIGAVGINELTKAPIERAELMKDLGAEFERALGEPPSELRLSVSENKTAAHLAQSKYSSGDWNASRL
jgi:lipoate-protein ligase A